MAGLAARFAKMLGPGKLAPSRRRPTAPRRRLACEALEPRALLTASGLGTDYTLMGGRWNNTVPISFSFPPDGVSWDQGTNGVNAALNAEFGGTSWQGVVAKALQTWAAVTNLNFTQVADGPYGFNASGVNQGDPNFGDIRIGGYNFGPSQTIARTYGPPPNGQTGAGDVELNTNYNFAPGGSYDFGTVILHELGHSLGLGESPQPSSVMYTYYSGVRQALSSYDIEGIQSLYGARTSDSYQSAGQGTSAASAVDVTGSLNAGEQAQVSGVSLSTIGDVEFFSVVAPNFNGATLQVSAVASGLSLLSPKVTVIDPSTGAVLGVNGNAALYGDNATVSIPNAVAGHRYLIEVTGATGDVFSVGSYALQVGFNGGTANNPSPAPVQTTPTPVQTAPAPVQSAPAPVQTTTAPVTIAQAPTIAPDSFAYNNSFLTATELGSVTQTSLGNLTLPSGPNYQLFAFEVSQPGLVFVAAGNVNVIVGDSLARPVASGTGLLGFLAPQAGRYYLLFLSSNGAPVANYGFAVELIPSPPVVVQPIPVTTTTTITTTTTTSRTNHSTKVRVASVSIPKGPVRTTRPKH